jgi:transposase
MKKMSIQQRNAKIVEEWNAGASCSAIASEFDLSRSNIHQIVNRSKIEGKRQEQSKKLLAEIRMLDDIDKNWPAETLIQGLQFSWRATRCLKRHFDCSESCEISLRKIMDFLITDYEEIPHDLSQACPAFKQKDVGRKTYAALINCLSEQNLGCAFGIEWNKRLHKFMCFMRKRWGYIPDSYRQRYEI